MNNVKHIESLRHRIEYSKRQLRLSQAVFLGAASMSGIMIEAVSSDPSAHTGKILPSVAATIVSAAWLRSETSDINKAKIELDNAISRYRADDDS